MEQEKEAEKYELDKQSVVAGSVVVRERPPQVNVNIRPAGYHLPAHKLLPVVYKVKDLTKHSVLV